MYIERRIWGRSGFDRMFGESKLRVSALFRVINEQKTINATTTSNIVRPVFGAEAQAYALAS